MKKLRAIFLIFLGQIVLIQNGSAAGSAISIEKIVGVLQNVHAVAWHSIVDLNLASERLIVKEYLEQIISQPELLNEFAPGPGEIALIRERAISEYGKFARQENGRLSPEARSFYNQHFDAKNERNVIFLMQSLRDTNTPEAVEMLIQATNSDFPSVSHFALSMIEGSFIDPAFIDISALQAIQKSTDLVSGYNPFPTVSLDKRENQAGWKQAIEKVKEQLTQLSNKKDLSPALRRKTSKIREIVAAYEEGRSPNLGSSKESTAAKQGKRLSVFHAGIGNGKAKPQASHYAKRKKLDRQVSNLAKKSQKDGVTVETENETKTGGSKVSGVLLAVLAFIALLGCTRWRRYG
jgi:hypothetical protein